MTKVTAIEIERQLREEIRPLVLEHDKILIRGNGEPSLQERFRNIEAYIKEDRENRRYYSRIFISIAITNIVSLIFAAIVWFAKIIPVLEKIEAMQKAGL